jgi:Sec-independent protein secretion pathway component TatC
MKNLSMLSLMAAVVCFIIAGVVSPAQPYSSRLVAIGLAFFAGSFLLAAVPHS